MAKTKKLSNAFSSGGGGVHFEAHVQASFITLMLTGGFAPCLPCWPITEVVLQGKIKGFDTDDLIVLVKEPFSKECRKLLGQIKHSIAITKGSKLFGEVIQAAWNDFNNPQVFSKDKDVIALITGPLSETDMTNVQWLLNVARHTKSKEEFSLHATKTNFSPSKSEEKLAAFKYWLKVANDDNDVSEDELYGFLKRFHILGYDLGYEHGVALSLLHSHLSQFQNKNTEQLWSRIVDVVQTWNQSAGTITPDSISDDIREALKPRPVEKMPEEFKVKQTEQETNWSQHPDATYLALAVLIGSWDDNNQADIDVITTLLGIGYEEWLRKAREILHCHDSPLSLKNGIWMVNSRVQLWHLLGSRIMDSDLSKFSEQATSVLKEPDPAFELLPEDRYAAPIFDKVPTRSHWLRKGIAEGLAILGSQAESCTNCARGKAEATCVLVVRDLLANVDWISWGSLNDFLPTLAEAAPGEFLDLVSKALHQTPCPFDELFSQERNGVTSRNYLTGLLWALEGLAWNAEHFVHVCVALALLASRDPGGQSGNRPSSSLATILLPWFPQTLASADKRKVAVETIIDECPKIAWNLLVELLPEQRPASSGTYKPVWRKFIPDGWEPLPQNEEYKKESASLAELAVITAGQDASRLSVLIDLFDYLPKPAFERLLQVLGSEPISKLPEEQRLVIWNHLSEFAEKHRQYRDAEWALPNESIVGIEQVAKQLAPTNPLYLYQPLFANRDHIHYTRDTAWEKQQQEFDARRDEAVKVIFEQDGVDGVLRFAELVVSPYQVGYSLGVIDSEEIDRTLLPNFLDTSHNSRKDLVYSFIRRRFHRRGWEWCDGKDKSGWTPTQIGFFLTCLPFGQQTWERASELLPSHQNEYWRLIYAYTKLVDGDSTTAIEKFIEHGRPRAAINRLSMMHHNKKTIDPAQCCKALLAAVSSKEPQHAMDMHSIVDLIKFLQEDCSVKREDLCAIEWAYLPLLTGRNDASPKLLEHELTANPEFFCSVIRLVFRSTKEKPSSKERDEESIAMATNAWHLLDTWKIPPGTQEDGTFSDEKFEEWLHAVKEACTESGHFEVALLQIGKVLIYSAADPDIGLWIHGTVAAALNDPGADKMRDGFINGVYNSRGVHYIDPTGESERKLAEQFRQKAEEVENAKFHRFAAKLRQLADRYDREAEEIIDEHE